MICAMCGHDSENKRYGRAEDVLQEVASRHGLTVAQLRGPRRERKYVLARVEASKILRTMGYTFTAIGAAMNRDHTSIMHHMGHKLRTDVDNKGNILEKQ